MPTPFQTHADQLITTATLEGPNVKLVPLGFEHEGGLTQAAADGKLWELNVTSVPEPENTHAYIKEALEQREAGNRFAYAVLAPATNTVLGSTSYHDIIAKIKRVEIGYTWYAKRMQRTYLNTACKYTLLSHAFDVIKCNVVGLRTDILNTASQKAIERLGAKKDGVIRLSAMRKDGSIRDTVMYSISKDEWPQIKKHLQLMMKQHGNV